MAPIHLTRQPSIREGPDKDTFESMLRALGIEGNDVIREEFSRSRYPRHYWSRQRLSWRASLISMHQGGKQKPLEGGRASDARPEHRITSNSSRDQDHPDLENPQDHHYIHRDIHSDIYQDCHYRRGSRYGYLINRCPDPPLDITASQLHGSSNVPHSVFNNTAETVRHIDYLLAPGMIMMAMLVLLFVSIAIVELMDLIWKRETLDDEVQQRCFLLQTEHGFSPQDDEESVPTENNKMDKGDVIVNQINEDGDDDEVEDRII